MRSVPVSAVYKIKGHSGRFLSRICRFPYFNNNRSWATTFQDDDKTTKTPTDTLGHPPQYDGKTEPISPYQNSMSVHQEQITKV